MDMKKATEYVDEIFNMIVKQSDVERCLAVNALVDNIQTGKNLWSELSKDDKFHLSWYVLGISHGIKISKPT